jgi:hypothetical protein
LATPATDDTRRGRGIALIKRLVQSVIIHVDVTGTRVMLHHPLPTQDAIIDHETDPHDVDESIDPEETLISA